jgi:hypothetical protein
LSHYIWVICSAVTPPPHRSVLSSAETKGLATGTYQLRVDLGDGVVRTTVIRLN